MGIVRLGVETRNKFLEKVKSEPTPKVKLTEENRIHFS